MSKIISAQNCPQCGAPVNVFKGKCDHCKTSLQVNWLTLQKVDGIDPQQYPKGRVPFLDNIFLALVHTVCAAQSIEMGAMFEEGGNTSTITILVRDVLYNSWHNAGRITSYGNKNEVKYALWGSEWDYGMHVEFHLHVKGAWKTAGNYFVLTDMQHMNASDSYCQGENELLKNYLVGMWARVIPMAATHFQRFEEERKRETEAAIAEKRRKQQLPFWNLSKYF